jgi:hypothetical protein
MSPEKFSRGLALIPKLCAELNISFSELYVRVKRGMLRERAARMLRSRL